LIERTSVRVQGELFAQPPRADCMHVLISPSKAVMTRYIASEANLKMMMNLLRDKSKNIQFEAFHVFKVRLLCSLSYIPFRAHVEWA
jgi:hypothetical protein